MNFSLNRTIDSQNQPTASGQKRTRRGSVFSQVTRWTPKKYRTTILSRSLKEGDSVGDSNAALIRGVITQESAPRAPSTPSLDLAQLPNAAACHSHWPRKQKQSASHSCTAQSAPNKCNSDGNCSSWPVAYLCFAVPFYLTNVSTTGWSAADSGYRAAESSWTKSWLIFVWVSLRQSLLRMSSCWAEVCLTRDLSTEGSAADIALRNSTWLLFASLFCGSSSSEF